MSTLNNNPAKKSDAVFDCTLTGFSIKITHNKNRQLKESALKASVKENISRPVKRPHEDIESETERDIEMNNDTEMEKTYFERDLLNKTENWQCKDKEEIKAESSNNRASERLKPDYLTPRADRDVNETSKTIDITILKNGSLCCAAIVGEQNIIARESCAFDSTFQTVANGINTCTAYKIDMTTTTNCNAFIKLMIDILKRGKIIANDYGTRATILRNTPIFQKKKFHSKYFICEHQL